MLRIWVSPSTVMAEMVAECNVMPAVSLRVALAVQTIHTIPVIQIMVMVEMAIQVTDFVVLTEA
jgi:hypothetical protein